MIEKTFTIQKLEGISSRSAAAIVKQSVMKDVHIKLNKDGNEARGDSIIQILFLNATQGDHVHVQVDGDDSEIVMGRIAEIFEFGAGI